MTKKNQAAHTSSATSAAVFVNLGTPASTKASDVGRFLREFLSDGRVVEIPKLFWNPLLYCVIVPVRAPKSAKAYQEIWMDEGSPLMVYSQRLVDKVAPDLVQHGITTKLAMRYGEPSIKKALNECREEGIERIAIIPMYAQYSATTSATIFDAVFRQVMRWRKQPSLAMVRDYHVDAGWVTAVADSVRAHWAEHGQGDCLLFSFHGLPRRCVAKGDPYPYQCEASVAAIVDELGLTQDQWMLSYQSRFGPEKWLSPSTDTALEELQANGKQTIDVIAPGFSADCLETLEEIAMGYGEQVQERGGKLRYIAALNDSDAHAKVMSQLALNAINGLP